MSVASLSNAGLRPTSAFVVIGVVVLAVAGRVAWLALGRPAARPDLEQVAEGEVPSYAIADTTGRELACFVPRFDLELSPRAMWQIHTPAHMAQEIARVLGGEPTAEELLQAFLPDARDGVIVADAWDLSARQAHAVGRWLEGDEEAGCPPIHGLWLERAPEGADARDRERRGWRIAWRPRAVLDPTQREAHGCGSARAWGRHLALGLHRALFGEEHEPRLPAREVEARCDEVWSALLPSAWSRPVEGLPAERVLELRALLEREGVSPWQMRVAHGRDRVYPVGEHELFGDWGFLSPEDTEPVPRFGLERLCDRLLASAPWDERIERVAPSYRWRRDRTVRGTRAPAYLERSPGSEVPRVVTTLDVELMGTVRRELEGVMQEHRPALAMAIVVDVTRGDVLAVDAAEAYPIAPFAPVYHVFTTGSTFKVLTMACALEEGVTREEEEIDLGQGAWRVHYARGSKAGRASGRVIREAEGALTGVQAVRDAFAHSVNAGMTQVGLRMEDTAFHGYLERLGYGRKPGTGLGSERAGHLAALPWSYAYTHASICFGHELSTTLWQHAAALATVVRGGVRLPLRLVRAVEQGNDRWNLEPASGERVFSEGTSARVRDLMRHGAREGTGDDVRALLLDVAERARRARDPGAGPVAGPLLDVGTKTGTAEKVRRRVAGRMKGEVCVHLEMEARRRHRAEGRPFTTADYHALLEARPPHRRCYTSSICVFVRDTTAPEPRTLMALVVVEEPRGKARFGADVAGPAAARILAEALGLTTDGELPEAPLRPGFFAASDAMEASATHTAALPRNEREIPWQLPDPRQGSDREGTW